MFEINLVKVLDQTSKLEETQGEEEQVKQNHEEASRQI